MKIIIVDDERLALENAVSELNKALKVADSSLYVENGNSQQAEIYAFRSAEETLEFAQNTFCDIAFLDIQMKGISGIELARELKALCPRINIIFTTAYLEYMNSAFELYASGYCLKPITAEKIVRELENLRHKIKNNGTEKRLHVKTFGNFEVYDDDKPIHFKYSKAKELLAYLIDRNGSMCSNRELIGILWEDDIEDHLSYLKKVRSELIAGLKLHGFDDIIVQRRGSLGIIPAKINCDYFDWLAGDEKAIESYRGEYMTQYSWSEYTHGYLEK